MFDRKHNKTHAQPSQDENEYENIISPYLLVRVTLEIVIAFIYVFIAFI